MTRHPGLQDAHLALGNAAEIIGKVQPDLSVKVFQCTDWGSNIGGHFLASAPDGSQKGLQTASDSVADYAACNVLVEATHKYKDIFYEPQS